MSFKIEREGKENSLRYLLMDEHSGHAAEIVPAAGAILSDWKIRVLGRTIHLIDGYSSQAEINAIQITEGFKSAKLSPFACRVKDGAYSWKAKNYTIEKFILRGHAIHGLLYDAPFILVQEQVEKSFASLTMEYSYKGTDAGFPFPYNCTVVYRIEKDNKLSLTTTIQNLASIDIPMVDGWHPYFTLGNSIDDLYLLIPSEIKLEYDSYLLPTGNLLNDTSFSSLRKIGNTEFDNGYMLDFTASHPICILRNQTEKIQIEISPDVSYLYLQVYTPNHRRSIAIENLSAAPDAFNNGMGLITLKPGESKKFETSFKINIG